MRTMMNERLLREYIRQSLITEDSMGDAGISMSDAVGQMGVAYGSPSDMKSVFITPFLDVFKTALGKTKEITTKAKTLAWVGLQSVLPTVIPFYSYRYRDVFEKEKKDIEKIRSEYSEVYKRTNEALAAEDTACFAFMINPGLFLGAVAAKKGVEATKGLMSVFSGGASDDIYDGAKNSLKAAGDWLLDADIGLGGGHYKPKSKSGKSPSSIFSGYTRDHVGGVISERKKKKKKKGPKFILTNKKFIDKVANSSQAKSMQKAASETYKKSLEEIEKTVSEIMSINSIEGIEQNISKMKPVEGAETPPKSKVLEDIKNIKNMKDPNEKKVAEQKLVQAFTKSPGAFFAKNLETKRDDIKAKVKAAGLDIDPDQLDIVKDYNATIAKIKGKGKK